MNDFREKIENIRMRLSNRIDQLIKNQHEYEEEGRFEAAKNCASKSNQLLMVLGDLDEALK